MSAKHDGARRREIAERHDRSRARDREPFSLLGIQIKEARRLMRHRHGAPMRDTELARHDVRFLAALMARLSGGAKRFHNFATVEAPWLDRAEIDRVWAAATADPPHVTAHKIAQHFELTWQERVTVGIRNLPAVDAKGDTLRKLKAERRRELDRARKRRKRAKQGKVNRKQYLAAALTRSRPWEREGISRATWYRRVRTDLSQHEERSST
jgi:hypothetical protein